MEARDFLHLFIDKTRPNLLVWEVGERRNNDSRTLYEIYTKDEPTFTVSCIIEI